MRELLSFGIGCFHFGIARHPPFAFTGREYLRDVERELRSIANISLVEIVGDEDFENDHFDIKEEHQPLSDGVGPTPHCGFSIIRFELYVPFRMQAELLGGGDEEFLRTETERFRVSMRYQFNHPIAFVELIDPRDKGDPSDAVRLVHELLKRSFDKPDARLRFERLGPSPFHAECHIGFAPGGDSADRDITCRRYPRRGYDELKFEANPDRFDTLEEAAEAIYDEIAHELDVFYDIVALGIQDIHEWSEAEGAFSALVAAHQEKGYIARAKNVFRWGKLIGNAFVAIATFEGNSIQREGVVMREFRDEYSEDHQQPCFKEYVERNIHERAVYPVKNAMALIGFIEQRRALRSQNWVRLLASIGGGVIGALLTLAVRSR